MRWGIGDRGSGFEMGIIGSTGVWRFSIGDWRFRTGLEIAVRDCRLRMGIRSLVTKLWFAIPIEIVDGEEFKIMYEVWVRDCEWQLYIGARA